jgi:DNA-binding SARP family transcriptional activator
VIRFYLAGRVAVEGRALVDQADLPGPQGRRVLVKLVLERDRPVPVDELAAATWGSDVPSSSEQSLRAVISRLRSAITQAGGDGSRLVAESGCYQLRLPDAWVDLEEAANAIDRAEGALRARQLGLAWSHATVASAIAERPLLPGEDVAWIDEQRRHLASLRWRSLAVLAEVWRERGDHTLAVETARRLVALDPLREASHQVLITSHVAAGDNAAAAGAYARCREVLRTELGIDPSPATQALHRSVL